MKESNLQCLSIGIALAFLQYFTLALAGLMNARGETQYLLVYLPVIPIALAANYLVIRRINVSFPLATSGAFMAWGAFAIISFGPGITGAVDADIGNCVLGILVYLSFALPVAGGQFVGYVLGNRSRKQGN